jgi:hypothetical protein
MITVHIWKISELNIFSDSWLRLTQIYISE